MLQTTPKFTDPMTFFASSQQEVAMMGLSLGFELQELLPRIDRASHGPSKGQILLAPCAGENPSQ